MIFHPTVLRMYACAFKLWNSFIGIITLSSFRTWGGGGSNLPLLSKNASELAPMSVQRGRGIYFH